MNDGMAPFTIFNSDRDIIIPVAVHFAARVDYKNSITEAGSSWGGYSVLAPGDRMDVYAGALLEIPT